MENDKIDNYKESLDRISIAVSTICMVHCALLPLFFSTLPLWGIEVLENVWIESLTIIISLGFGGWAIWKGYRKHHHKLLIPLMFISGLLIMIAANLEHAATLEVLLKSGGAIAVIAAHIQNCKYSHKCAVCETKC